MASAFQSQPSFGSVTPVAPSSHPFTCNTCQVAFRGSEAQKTHMKSDWHRYNLKRRVASLPPLSSEVFAEKVLTAQASSSAAAAKAAFEKTCSSCQKTYYSENAYQNHIGSLKHKQKAASAKKGGAVETGSIMSSTFSVGDPIDTFPSDRHDPVLQEEFSKVVNGMKEATLDEKKHPLSATSTNSGTPTTNQPDDSLRRCLFCNYYSPTWKLSVNHMERHHALFIPEQKYLVDLEGLVRFLHTKITEHHQCLYCNSIKSSTEAVQTHMRDKGHCMIAFETEGEMLSIGDFYDFRGTYSDSEGAFDDLDMSDYTPKREQYPSHCSKRKKPSLDPKKYPTKVVDANGEVHDIEADEVEDEGWETDSDAFMDEVETATDGRLYMDPDLKRSYERLPLHRHHSQTEPRPHKSVDGYHAHVHRHGYGGAVFSTDYELHLPNGRTVGHRSLNRYYRQNLRDYPTPEERAARRAIAASPSSTMDTDEGDSEDMINSKLAEARDISRKENEVMKLSARSMGMIGATIAQKRAAARAEKRDQKMIERAQSNYRWGNEKKANKQKHFRDQLLQ